MHAQKHPSHHEAPPQLQQLQHQQQQSQMQQHPDHQTNATTLHPWPNAHVNLRLLCGEEDVDLPIGSVGTEPPADGHCAASTSATTHSAVAAVEAQLRRSLIAGPVGARLTAVLTPGAVLAVAALALAAKRRHPRVATAAATAPALAFATFGSAADAFEAGSERWGEAVRSWAGSKLSRKKLQRATMARECATPPIDAAAKPPAYLPLSRVLSRPEADGCAVHVAVALKRGIEVSSVRPKNGVGLSQPPAPPPLYFPSNFARRFALGSTVAPTSASRSFCTRARAWRRPSTSTTPVRPALAAPRLTSKTH